MHKVRVARPGYNGREPVKGRGLRLPDDMAMRGCWHAWDEGRW